MIRIIILLTLFCFASTFLAAQDFSGTYHAYNPSNGIRVTLNLNQNSKSLVSGNLILNDNDTYEIEGKVEEYYGEAGLVGTIRKESELSFFEAYLEANQLIFTWIPSDGSNQPDYDSAIDVVLDKTNSSDKNLGREQTEMYEDYSEKNNANNTQHKNENYQRDPALVGLWRYSESYTSGDFSMVTQRFLEVRPDGTYSYGKGQVAGGGNSGSFDSGRGGDVITGKWRTENGMIYIDEGGYGNWVPYSGYYVEGNSLMLKFNNGAKEIWERL